MASNGGNAGASGDGDEVSRGPWQRWDAVAERVPFPGVHFRPVAGEAAMACRVWLEPGSVVMAHAHPHEQISIVLEGELEFTLGDETRTVGAGEVVVIRGGTSHAVIAGPAGASVIDVFSPPRQDYVSTT
ncbi:MAG: cupin domain-containing protein [Chloroflexota bacterium]|nr:cupin domain-containing protein [Chloroflexota bacterium]